MLYYPLGLAPRTYRVPWVSLCFSIFFIAASITMKREVDLHQARIEKAQEAVLLAQSEKWNLSEEEKLKREEQLQDKVILDSRLSLWILQPQAASLKGLLLTPWIIPNFEMLIMVVLLLPLFGSFVECRMSAIGYAFGFLSLYYAGFLMEILLYSDPYSLVFGGTTSIFILSAGVMALFPAEKWSFWLGDDRPPLGELPAWILFPALLLFMEYQNLAGYQNFLYEYELGYAHLSILLASYYYFRVTRTHLQSPFLSLWERHHTYELRHSQGVERLRSAQTLVKINPRNYEAIELFYNGALFEYNALKEFTPETWKFMEAHLSRWTVAELAAGRRDKMMDYMQRSMETVGYRVFLKGLAPHVWISLARALERRSLDMETLYLYSSLFDQFPSEKTKQKISPALDAVLNRLFTKHSGGFNQQQRLFEKLKDFLSKNPHPWVAEKVQARIPLDDEKTARTG